MYMESILQEIVKKSGFSSFGNMGVLCNDLVYCAFAPFSSGNKFKKMFFMSGAYRGISFGRLHGMCF